MKFPSGRNLLRVTVCILWGLIMISCGSDSQNETNSDSLNYFLIFTDEMEFNDLACYGGDITTPNIDRLAKDGILFTHAYTPASMCTPSRYSVLTGQFPGRCTAPSFLEKNPSDQPYNIAWNSWITADKKTLPRVLNEHGFVTGMAGKWHIGEVPDGTILPGFKSDESLDDPETEEKLMMQQAVYQDLVRNLAGFDVASNVVWENYDNHKLEALRFHNFPWMVKGALTFLDKQKDSKKPFFFYFAPTAVHGPNHVADISKDITYTPGGRDSTLQRFQVNIPELKEQISGALPKTRHRVSGMAQTDHAIGLIRNKLKETGLDRNTVIFFMSDHNIEPGKATSFEKGIHIPMIVCWPGKPQGIVSKALVQNTDIYPTILESAGIQVPAEHVTDGVSMIPLLTDPEQSIRKFIFSENGYTRSVSDGTFKYIALRYPESLVRQMESGRSDHAPSYVRAWPQAHSAIAMNGFPSYFDQDQFYNLKEDPYEQVNLYQSMKDSEEFKLLRAALESHLSGFNHPFDLTPIPFLESPEFRKLTQKNLEFDLLSIPWLTRDHGFINWPPTPEE